MVELDICRKLAAHLYGNEWTNIEEGESLDFLAESIKGFLDHQGKTMSNAIIMIDRWIGQSHEKLATLGPAYLDQPMTRRDSIEDRIAWFTSLRASIERIEAPAAPIPEQQGQK